MRARYVVLVAPRDLIARCFFKCQLLFKSEISYFVLIGSQWIFQGLTLEIVFLGGYPR